MDQIANDLLKQKKFYYPPMSKKIISSEFSIILPKIQSFFQEPDYLQFYELVIILFTSERYQQVKYDLPDRYRFLQLAISNQYKFDLTQAVQLCLCIKQSIRSKSKERKRFVIISQDEDQSNLILSFILQKIITKDKLQDIENMLKFSLCQIPQQCTKLFPILDKQITKKQDDLKERIVIVLTNNQLLIKTLRLQLEYSGIRVIKQLQVISEQIISRNLRINSNLKQEEIKVSDENLLSLISSNQIVNGVILTEMQSEWKALCQKLYANFKCPITFFYNKQHLSQVLKENNEYEQYTECISIKGVTVKDIINIVSSKLSKKFEVTFKKCSSVQDDDVNKYISEILAKLIHKPREFKIEKKTGTNGEKRCIISGDPTQNQARIVRYLEQVNLNFRCQAAASVNVIKDISSIKEATKRSPKH